jgi:hypothetical protein
MKEMFCPNNNGNDVLADQRFQGERQETKE